MFIEMQASISNETDTPAGAYAAGDGGGGMAAALDPAAAVKLAAEIQAAEDEKKFAGLPIWQREKEMKMAEARRRMLEERERRNSPRWLSELSECMCK
jgi:hypothetical protein